MLALLMSVRRGAGGAGFPRRSSPIRAPRSMRHSKPNCVPGQPSPEGILFATVFGEPEQAVGLLRGFLPPEVAATIDWQSLSRVDRTCVDRALCHLFTDVVFDARIGGRAGYVYMLLERAS